jgi:hypothetical protein
MIKWLRKLWRGNHDVGDELDQRIHDAEQQKAEVEAMRPETRRLEKRLVKHERDNHFAERFEKALLARRRHA